MRDRKKGKGPQDWPEYTHDKRQENPGRPRGYASNWKPRGIKFPPELAEKIMGNALRNHRTFSDEVRLLTEAGFRAVYGEPKQGFFDRVFWRKNS